jgi:hypothetical protein
MAKGATSKRRPGGNGRDGLARIPPHTKRALDDLIANPDALDQLDATTRARREVQLAEYRSLLKRRSERTRFTREESE